MTTSAKTKSESLTETNRFEGTINSDVLIRFGKSEGALITDFVLTVVTSIRVNQLNTNVILYLRGVTPELKDSRTALGLDGRWGYPYPTKHNNYDQGYDGAGLIEDLPNDILTAISAATGFHGLQELVTVKTSMV